MHINMELTPHSDGTGIQLQIPRPGILISHNLRTGPLTVQVRLGLGFSADLPGKIGTPFPRRGSLRPNAKSWIWDSWLSYFMDLRGWGDWLKTPLEFMTFREIQTHLSTLTPLIPAQRKNNVCRPYVIFFRVFLVGEYIYLSWVGWWLVDFPGINNKLQFMA